MSIIDEKSSTPKNGDLVLFQLTSGQWTAGKHPILAQKLYGKDYEDLEQKALEYAADWAQRGIHFSVWREVNANKDEYVKVL